MGNSKRHCKSGHIMKKHKEQQLSLFNIDTIMRCTGMINKKVNGRIQTDKDGNNIKVKCKLTKHWQKVGVENQGSKVVAKILRKDKID